MALDYNPDKERHVDHKYIAVRATKRKLDSIDVDGKEMKFSKEGFMAIDNPALAQDVRQKYHGDVTVSRVRHPHVSDRGHNYFFGQMPEMPWKKEKNNESI